MRIELVGLSCMAACAPWGPRQQGGDSAATPADDALVLSPGLLEMGRVSVGDAAVHSASFTVQNVGDVARTIHGFDEIVQVSGPASTAFHVEAEAPVLTLAPGESRAFEVRFIPPEDGDWVSEVRLNYGLETLRLRGSGHAPVLAVAPPDIASTPIGCRQGFDVRVDNRGRERLRIEAAEVQAGPDFSLAVELPALGIAPGQGLNVRMRFMPGWQEPADSTRTARLVLPTNDPVRGTVELPLEAFAWAGSEVVETFRFHSPSQVDVLFVADTDGVMSAHVDKAQAAMEGFLDVLDAANVSLHAAVLTGASACPVTTPGWVDDDAPFWQRLQVLRNGFEGATGPGSEHLLALAVDALEQDAAGGCLEGFRRPGAALHVVALTGGPDGGSLTPSENLAALAEAHPEARDVVVSAVLATESAGCGGAAYGAGYAEAVLASDGEIVDL
ncbi:MAG: choice-of-anchor D domain-containing protein, partial [Myxococcota bacterium]|nr:choice-of-anchor D domain-containing protein [Myxococcota bacterium]